MTCFRSFIAAAIALTLSAQPAAAQQKPLVIMNGQTRQLPVGTSLDGSQIINVPAASVIDSNGTTAQAALNSRAYFVSTTAGITSATVPSAINGFVTLGYSSVGDGGGVSWHRVASQPAHTAKAQSADGAWWEMVPAKITPRMFGAVCRGAQSDAAQDTTGLTAALNYLINFNRGGVLDLDGGYCFLNAGYTAPTLTNANRFTIRNGKLQFVDSVTSGTQYFLDFSPITTLYGVTVTDVTFSGVNSTNNVLAKGGIKIANARTVVFDKNIIQGFTEAGIYSTSNDFGQDIRVTNNLIQAYVGTGTMPPTARGVWLLGGDNKVTGNYIGEGYELVHFGQSANMLANNHLWQYSYSSIRGVVCDLAQSMQITGNYIDTVQVILKGATSGYHFHGNVITGNKFYIPPNGTNAANATWTTNGSSEGMIVYAPQVAGSTVNQDVVTANGFVGENGSIPRQIRVDTTSGTITSAGGVNINSNSTYGFSEQLSEPRGSISLSAATSGSVDLSSKVPFGVLQSIRSSVLVGSSAVSVPARFTPLTGTNSTVTVNFSSAQTVTVNVVASINSL